MKYQCRLGHAHDTLADAYLCDHEKSHSEAEYNDKWKKDE